MDVGDVYDREDVPGECDQTGVSRIDDQTGAIDHVHVADVDEHAQVGSTCHQKHVVDDTDVYAQELLHWKNDCNRDSLLLSRIHCYF